MSKGSGRVPRVKEQFGEDEGFTLIELLVVITILGILAVIVVFAVRGIGDKGKNASISTDIQTVRTAEEAYCAKNGTYTDAAGLVSSKFLTSVPTYTSIVPTTGNCGGTGFVAGSPSSAPTTGDLVLGASNTTPPFSFLSASAPEPVQFTFGASSGLVTTANNNSSPAVLFASADEANVNLTITNGAATPVGLPGSCTASNCGGIAATKRLYAIGQLVVFQCSASGKTLAPASNAPLCKGPASGYVSTPATTPADIVSQLNAHPGPTGKYVLTIAEPCPTGSTGCTAHHPPTDGSAPNAPYGVAAYEALTSSNPGGGGLTQAQYDALVANGQIIFGSNVTNTQNNVVGGTAQFALLPESFVKSPGGDDTDPWTEVNPSTSSGAILHSPIKQYAVVLNHTAASPAGSKRAGTDFLNYLGGSTGQAVLAKFGYTSIGTYTPVSATDCGC